jgi:hypothetical protein
MQGLRDRDPGRRSGREEDAERGLVVVLAVQLLRARRAFATALQDRGWLLQRERESAAATAVDAERARIASELHDIVSHNVSDDRIAAPAGPSRALWQRRGRSVSAAEPEPGSVR